ncbi:hypothetical protein GCM10010985_06900 [Caballeronia grimmiae]|uniref:Uncharacterized protein n=1 Tax=Caballeronia grimmiae TaxID=1071679 RepID=A0ABQ1R3A5_9BURK|nr:hypothetical protein GCM10010985_06900 [Caballeronia grimmiae]
MPLAGRAKPMCSGDAMCETVRVVKADLVHCSFSELNVMPKSSPAGGLRSPPTVNAGGAPDVTLTWLARRLGSVREQAAAIVP